MIYACKTETKSSTLQTKSKTVTVKNKSKNKTYLCKINGKDWAYTKASGIVSRHKKTGIRSAIITFKNKLKKGSESVQVEYDTDKNNVIRVLVQIKRLNKEGKKISATYSLHTDTLDRNKETNMNGTIDLSNPTSASGTATFTIENRFEQKVLKNASDILIHITDLKFSNVGYSDLNKVFNK
jgi:hypothetical protein